MGISDLTVVIMTFERPAYVRRAIVHLERQKQCAIVVDGSNAPVLSDSECSNLNSVNYVHTSESFAKRLAIAGSLVETPFVVLQGDDDFQMASGLARCCAELKSHPNLSSSCGIPLMQRRLDNGEWHVFPWTSGSPALDWANASVIDSRPTARLRRHFNPYCPTSMYGVMRKSAFSQITAALPLLSIANIYREEFFFESVLALIGSIRVLPNLMWIKSNENVSITEREADIGFFEFLENPAEKDSLVQFVELVYKTVRSLEPQITLSLVELRETFEDLVKLAEREQFSRQSTLDWKSTIIRWTSGTPSIRRLARASRDMLQGTYSLNPWVRSGKKMRRRGVESDLVELREVSEIVTDFWR